jgi:chromate reductase
MMEKLKIAILIGSLRKESLNRKMAKALIALAPESLELEIIDIGDLPLYNEDLELSVPEAWLEFRSQMAPFNGVLFITPEYNRSVPAVLKNALDVGSRPTGQSCWDGKPAAVVTVSPGNIGGFGANHHLRQSLVYLNVPVMAQPEAYISGAGSLFDSEGTLTNESTTGFLATFMGAFGTWVEQNSKAKA